MFLAFLPLVSRLVAGGPLGYVLLVKPGILKPLPAEYTARFCPADTVASGG